MTTNFLEPFHVPNRFFFGLAALIFIGTLIFGFAIYPSLPAQIPSHFDWRGIPDAFTTTTRFSFFFPVLVQFFVSILLLIAYRFPDIGNIPRSMRRQLNDPATRPGMLWLLRHVFVLMLVIENLIFATITISTARLALGFTDRLNPWLMGSLVVWLLLILLIYFVGATRWLAHLPKQS